MGVVPPALEVLAVPRGSTGRSGCRARAARIRASSLFKTGGDLPMKSPGTALGAGSLLVLAAIAGQPGCRMAEDSASLPEEPSKSANEVMRGVTLRNFQVGDTEWVLQADTASVYRERKTIVAQDVRIDFFEGAKHVSLLTSDQGILNQATDDLEARGSVRVITDEGTVLTTEVLFWDHQGAKIHTDEYVEIVQGENRLAGYGLEADPGLDRVEIRRRVRGTLRQEPGELLDDSGAAADPGPGAGEP